MAEAVARLTSRSVAVPTISAITEEAQVHRATFYNHFNSVEEAAAYAISIGFEEFQLFDYGDRHLGADPTSVALRTLRAILGYLATHRELYRLASSWRSPTGYMGITDLLVEQVHNFREQFGDERAASGEAAALEDLYVGAGMSGVLSAAVEGVLGLEHPRVAEILLSMLPDWMRYPSDRELG
ncbi:MULTISPECIES: hypothetical protein [unclassified Streptomyces]|uniref:hypothetical protein n=1 Tax=unclassified Streptomyces TaxID=2593676 RepID=UPI003D8FEC78